MRILILGGTSFVGYHIVASALERGHKLTLFHRGKTGADEFGDQVEHLHGDRDPLDPSKTGGLTALEGTRTWDVVIDVSGYVPRIVRASLELLKDRCETYLYVSTISVYELPLAGHKPEEVPHLTIEDTTTEVVTPEAYGALKSLCEAELQAACPDKALIIRPGVVAGPRDYTDRFSYWVLAAHNAEQHFLCPDSPGDSLQVIDVRDLARFMVTQSESHARGAYNAAGPANDFTLGEMVAACVQGTGTKAQPTWIPWPFLAEHKIQPWSELPLCLGPDRSRMDLFRIDSTKAQNAGLTIRPLAETAKDTLAWLQQDPTRKLVTGLASEKSAATLAAWSAKQK